MKTSLRFMASDVVDGRDHRDAAKTKEKQQHPPDGSDRQTPELNVDDVGRGCEAAIDPAEGMIPP